MQLGALPIRQAAKDKMMSVSEAYNSAVGGSDEIQRIDCDADRLSGSSGM